VLAIENGVEVRWWYDSRPFLQHEKKMMRIAIQRLPYFTPKILDAMVRVYLIATTFWVGAYWLFGDKIELLGLANSMAVFYFYPLPIILLYLLLKKNSSLLPSWAVLAGVFIYYWGPLFSTPKTVTSQTQQTLQVMTFNVEGRQGGASNIIKTVLAEHADVVLFQELTPEIATVVMQELAIDYPYQVLAPEIGIGGKGAISKLPLEDSGEQMQGEWKGRPQVLLFEWSGEQAVFAGGIETREATANALVEFVQDEIPGSLVIAAGDANATHLNTSYKILIAVFDDAWWEAGYGLGHTYPFDNLGGRSFTVKRGIPIPQGLVRIDYILYAGGWQAIEAHLAAHNGGSDHRPVVAELLFIGD
jgi:endonuclease/exonuclease/phosphatase (EEP) superfamily protein YafD